MRPFRYFFDPLCLLACLAYAANRWLVGPHSASAFLHGYFNDLLLIPAALPAVLWLQRRLGWRGHDRPPTPAEIAGHAAVWSLVCEVLAPHLFPRATGDVRDILAYAAGAFIAGLWWNRVALFPARPAVVPRTACFDRLAACYDWMEVLLAGRKLERCRNAAWDDLPPVENALLAGEGHGRFLAALLRRNPGVKVTCVDASAVMLEVSRRRLEREGLPLSGVEFIHADLLAWRPPAGRYDLIATHFFLDCFPAGQLPAAIARLREAAKPGAYWFLSDFQIPRGGLRRLRARLIHRLMYAFFRLATRLPAAEVVCPAPYLRENGFRRLRRREFDWGLLYAEVWKTA